VASDTCALSFTTMRALPPRWLFQAPLLHGLDELGGPGWLADVSGRRDVTRAANLYWSRKLVLLGRHSRPAAPHESDGPKAVF
jgi:hypothetical protein